MDDLQKPMVRTHSDEAEFLLSMNLDSIVAGFHNLATMSGITEFTKIKAMLFLKGEYRNRLEYYQERSPLSSKVSSVAGVLLKNRTFQNAIVVAESDMPRLSLWSLFNDFLCVFVLAQPDKIRPVTKAIASRTENLITLYLAPSKLVFDETFDGEHRHNCDAVVFSKLRYYQTRVSQDDIRHYGKSTKTKLEIGKMYRCIRCGTQSIYSIMPLRRLLKNVPSQPFYLK